MSGSDERKGSEIRTTSRAPPSQRFISTTRGQGENRLSNTTFWLLTLNPSLSFESGRDFQRHLRKRTNFKDLVVCLFAWVLFSQLLARSTKQLEELTISSPQGCYPRKLDYFTDPPRKRMQGTAAATRLLFLGRAPHEQSLPQILFMQTQFPWIYACSYPWRQIGIRILGTLVPGFASEVWCFLIKTLPKSGRRNKGGKKSVCQIFFSSWPL